MEAGAATNGVGFQLVYSDELVRRPMESLAAFGGEPQNRLLDAIGAYNVSATRLRFRSGKAPDGTPWKLSHRVLRRGGQTLVLSGRLRSSLSHNVLAGNAGVEWGTNLVYGRIHQLGGEIKRAPREQSIYQRLGRDGQIQARFVKRSSATFERRVRVDAHTIKIPARPYLGMNNEDRREVEQLSLDALSRVTRTIMGRAP